MGSVQLIKEMVNDGINENPETNKRRFGAQQNLLSVWSVSTSCALENRKKKENFKDFMSTHPVFVISHIAKHIIQVEDSPITMLQPVNLQPVAGILQNKEATR